MPKAIKIIAEFVPYVPNEEDYPECKTIEEMAEFDIKRSNIIDFFRSLIWGSKKTQTAI